jgi:hypothetical protein
MRLSIIVLFGNVAELIIPPLEKEGTNLLSEKLTRSSDGRLFLVVLMVALAVAVSLSMVFASAAEAQQNTNGAHSSAIAQSSTSVFCNPNGFSQCRNTLKKSDATQTFTGSGTPRTNNVRFRSDQTGTVFSSCTFLGTASGADQYFCKTKKHRHHRRHH